MNYARFYALFNRLPAHTENMKEELVLQYTNGRTGSLREMTLSEYNALCNALQGSVRDGGSHRGEELKRHRSTVLKLMQQMGIDTTDWVRINAFCRDQRIAGKEFRELSLPELEALTTKLRGIQRKGGLRPQQQQESPAETEQPKPVQTVLFIPPFGGLPN